MSNVHVMDHPLIQHKIGIIRRGIWGRYDCSGNAGQYQTKDTE